MSSGTWTVEDEAASRGGGFDDRPAYIVKLPNQHEGARIDAPFSLINTRALMDGLLQERFRDVDGLASWVGEQK